MKTLILASAAVISLAAGADLLAQRAVAAPMVSGFLGATTSNDIENAQYVYGGRRYCWYLIGWRGPGWYRCGYASRRGFGWGGGEGWQGWRSSGNRDRVMAPPQQGRQPGFAPAIPMIGNGQRPPRAGARNPGPAAVAPGARRPAPGGGGAPGIGRGEAGRPAGGQPDRGPKAGSSGGERPAGPQGGQSPNAGGGAGGPGRGGEGGGERPAGR